MGSKFSKAVRPGRKAVVAAASVAPTSSYLNTHQTNEQPCQDPPPCLPAASPAEVIAPIDLPQPEVKRPVIPISQDDIHIATSTVRTESLQRRHSDSEMSLHISEAEIRQRVLGMVAYLEGHRMRNIDFGLGESTLQSPPPPPPPPPPPAPQTVVPSEPPPPYVEPCSQCLICCSDLPLKTEANYAEEVISPCQFCNSKFCTACVKRMFLDACKDSTRMPPRCCYNINLHHAKPLLTKEELATFRSKFEEWSTPNPLYCPVPVCSAFIPKRLLPEQMKTKVKPRVDSGVGTPKSDTFACPTCTADICMQCRQQAHPRSICSLDEFGLDAKTAKLLKRWGYKKCPKCGHGVKRMFGCNHMECRCGAHFCWSCMKDMDNCVGECDEGDDDDDYYSDDEPVEEVESPVNTNDATSVQSPITSTTDPETQTAPTTDTSNTTPEPPARPRNLDGGGENYWAGSGLEFGDEPSDDYQDRFWTCPHEFTTYTVSFTTALTTPAPEMECIKCWKTIHAVINPPKGLPSCNARIVAPGPATRADRHGVRGCRGLAGSYMPPRGLFCAGDSVGTADHLMAHVERRASMSPLRGNANANNDKHDHVRDIYGNIVHSTPALPRRRASVPTQHPDSNSVLGKEEINLAQECYLCRMLVCAECVDVAMDERGDVEENMNESDENGEERDQEGDERDQNMNESDQNRDERDENMNERDANMNERDQNTDERDQNTDERDQNTDDRDQNRDEKDQNEDERDQHGDEKDQNSDEKDQNGEDSDDDEDEHESDDDEDNKDQEEEEEEEEEESDDDTDEMDYDAEDVRIYSRLWK